MFCYMVICKAPLTGQAGENKSSNYGETQIITPVTSHSEVQEECHLSFQSAGPTTAKARFWDREVRDHGIRRLQRSAERSGREEWAEVGLDMSSHRYFGVRSCWDLATRCKTLYLIRAKIGNQCSSLIM